MTIAPSGGTVAASATACSRTEARAGAPTTNAPPIRTARMAVFAYAAARVGLRARRTACPRAATSTQTAPEGRAHPRRFAMAPESAGSSVTGPRTHASGMPTAPWAATACSISPRTDGRATRAAPRGERASAVVCDDQVGRCHSADDEGSGIGEPKPAIREGSMERAVTLRLCDPEAPQMHASQPSSRWTTDTGRDCGSRMLRGR
jgi:hypothetical protein